MNEGKFPMYVCELHCTDALTAHRIAKEYAETGHLANVTKGTDYRPICEGDTYSMECYTVKCFLDPVGEEGRSLGDKFKEVYLEIIKNIPEDKCPSDWFIYQIFYDCTTMPFTKITPPQKE